MFLNFTHFLKNHPNHPKELKEVVITKFEFYKYFILNN